MTPSVSTLARCAGALTLALAASTSHAVLIGGIEFPEGSVSFADAVVSFSPGLVSGGTQPTSPHLGGFNALGVPNYTGTNACTTQDNCTFVSLGDGGSIVLRFIDNKLTGSGNSDADLHIFEIGPDIEDTFVDISKNGSDWFSVGAADGSTTSIDIDQFGWGIGDIFEYVRLTDDTTKDGQSGATVGADIDAVGAITTVRTPPNEVPEPASGLLWLGALTALALARRRR